MAKILAEEAKDSGADIVKFQTHIPTEEMVESHPLYKVIADCSFDRDQERELFEHCNKVEILFMSTPFSIPAIHRLASLGVTAFKTGSGELNHIPFQIEVAKQRLPTFISTGMSTFAEIERTVLTVGRYNTNIVLMSCCSLYPSSPEHTNLKKIQLLRSLVPLVGQSDHTRTIASALGAIALGAVVIEKHFTLNKNSDGPDHASSITPMEFKQLTSLGREIYEAAYSEARKHFLPEEGKIREWANHFLVTNRGVKEGELLTDQNVTFKRVGPPTGELLPASELASLQAVNTSFKRPMDKDFPISARDLVSSQL